MKSGTRDRVIPTVHYRAVRCAVALTAIAAGGCGAEGSSGARVAQAPARAGVVWELDSAASRAAAPASLLAYVNGLQVLVIDGSDIYAGMTRLDAASAPGGGWELRLNDALTAELMPAGDALQLAFSSGERIGMHKRAEKEGD